MKMRQGGWSREVTQRELPIAKTIAGVNMRLTPGGVLRRMNTTKKRATLSSGKLKLNVASSSIRKAREISEQRWRA